jgi:tetratricopeptide (TPR) repeat protein
MAQVYPDYQSNVIATLGRTVERSPRAVVAYLKAMVRTFQYLRDPANWSEAMAIAEEIGSQQLIAHCALQLGTIYLDRGDVARAEELILGRRKRDGTRITGAYDRFKRIRNWRGSAHALVAEARLRAAQGRLDEARKALHRAANLAEEMNDPWLGARIDIGMAELEEQAGNLQTAADSATSGIGRARDLSDTRMVARGERILGRVRARQGQRKEALILLGNSAESLRRSGARVDAARAALDYVIAAQGVSGPAARMSQELLGFALDTFRSVGSMGDLRTAETIARRVGMPARTVTPA